MAREWLRRNRWGLLALPLAAAVALGPGIVEGWHDYRAAAPRDPVSSVDGQNYALGDARVRLVSLVRAELKGFNGKPLPVAGRLTTWQAKLAIDNRSPAPDGSLPCQIWVEDDQGRIFGADPDELSSGDKDIATCGRPDGVAAGSPYERLVYFVLPAPARPVAVRVVFGDRLPDYLRLPVP
jgi:hypothetical protein